MTRINLLPDGLLERQRRRRTNRIAVVAAALSLVVAATWATAAYRQLRGLAARTATAQARLNQERERTGKAEAVTAEANALRDLLALGDRLAQPVTLPGVLTLLTHLLPDSVALTRVTADAPTVAVVDRSKQSGTAQPPPASQVTHLSLEGLAISDLELAQVVSDLAAQKALANVKLVRSRPMSSAGVTRYAFEISIDVPPAARAQDPVGRAGEE